MLNNIRKVLGRHFALVVFTCLLPWSVHCAHEHALKLDIETGFELPLLKTIKQTSNEKISSHDKTLINKSNNSLKLSQYKGKVVYIDFWASWCRPCLVSMPLLNKLRNKYKDDGFEIIAINLDEDPEQAIQFMNAMTIDYPVVSDISGAVAKQYNVNGLPSAYIIGGNGVVKLTHKGFKKSDIKFIEAHVNKLIAELE